MSKRIYVGNLSYQTTEDDLADLFEQVGEVDSVNIVTDHDTGLSKGFAFVEMDNEGADKAIAQLNATELKGKPLTVNEALPLQDRSSGAGKGRSEGWDFLDTLIGAIDGPSDWASQHDHYLYGTPKH